MIKLKNLLTDSMNVYLTKHYIVKQNIVVTLDSQGNSYIHSNDIYILRNRKRDKEFLRMFADRDCLKGKRIHSATHIRTYIK